MQNQQSIKRFSETGRQEGRQEGETFGFCVCSRAASQRRSRALSYKHQNLTTFYVQLELGGSFAGFY